MPQTNCLKIGEPTTLRRSPRFLHPTLNNPRIGSPLSKPKSINGFSNLVKSANGSRRMGPLSENFDGVEPRRRSPRLSLVGKENVGFPVTPIRVGERKLIGGSGNGFSMNFDRMVTRSQSRLMGRNVEGGNGKEIGCDSGKCGIRGGNSRKPLSLVRSLNVRKIGFSEGKENRVGYCEGIVCGLANVGSGMISRVGRKGRQDNVGGYVCKEVVSISYPKMTCNDGKKNAGIGAKNVKRKSMRVFEGKENATRDLARKGIESKDCDEVEIEKVGKENREALAICRVLGRDEKKEHDSSKDTRLTGVKRKRNELGLQGTNQGWTKEQEAALNKAYFTAKPSPHFWKKVAKLVPGKSAQECFDKVHSDNQTPICSKPASRTRLKKSPSDILVLGNNLFKSAEKSKSRKGKTKSKSQVARKTVRHLLQKYSHINQNDEADLFSVLEPSVIPSSEAYQVTPKSLLTSPEPSAKSYERYSSASMKRLSRFSNNGEGPLTSPPVLKKVKNMALHEKYIDLLHVRERKRKVAFSRCSKLAQKQKGKEANSVQTKDMIRAAKNALVSDAKDVIDKFRDSQANIMEEFSESEEVYDSDHDEDELL